MKHHWSRFESAEAVAEDGCDKTLAAAKQAIEQRGSFHILLAGGSTPTLCYRRLASSDADWPHWHIYFGDERCLPKLDPARNSQMAALALTEQVAIPSSQIHPIPAELGAEEAAKQYDALISNILPFDMVLLGMGEDGHTASLFPGQQHPAGRSVVAVHNAPKPPADRVSLSAAALSNCRQLLFLVTGRGKQQAVAQWRNGKRLPITQIEAIGPSEVLIDADAWPANQPTNPHV
ncbi:MAG: 6-phosphogluconolactonase [Candidatus Polarisedimenticolaceae bacterium]|nr:6-phosphogluconolactonase [Candidatus Polarisedimenticolaceae bacterium]